MCIFYGQTKYTDDRADDRVSLMAHSFHPFKCFQ